MSMPPTLLTSGIVSGKGSDRGSACRPHRVFARPPQGSIHMRWSLLIAALSVAISTAPVKGQTGTIVRERFLVPTVGYDFGLEGPIAEMRLVRETNANRLFPDRVDYTVGFAGGDEFAANVLAESNYVFASEENRHVGTAGLAFGGHYLSEYDGTYGVSAAAIVSYETSALWSRRTLFSLRYLVVGRNSIQALIGFPLVP